MILVDTSVWIDFLKGTASPHSIVLRRLLEREEEIAITGVIFTEILQGVQDEKNFITLKELLLELSIFNPKDTETYLHAANIFRTCRKKGKTVRKTVGCLIAAISIENRLPLLHNDKDFSAIAECTNLVCVRV